MLTAEHAQMSLTPLERSQVEFNGGNTLIASELLWGAAAHAILAIATEREWHKDSHGAIKSAVRRLSRERYDDRMLTYVDSDEKLHENFYHNNLNAGEITHRREQAENLVPYLLALLP